MQKTDSGTSARSIFQSIVKYNRVIGNWVAISAVKRWLKPPTFDHPEENQRARTLYTCLLITPFVSNLIFIMLFFSIPDRLMTFTIFMVLNLMVIAALVLIRQKKLQLAGGMFLCMLWVLATFTVFIIHGDISSPALGAYLLMILGAGVFIGPRTAMAFSGLVWVSLVAFIIADRSG